MQSGSDPLTAPSSFTSRKSAAGNLPPFELPPPPLAALHSKYQYQPYNPKGSNHSQPGSGSVASAGNLLTPPNTHPGEGGSPSSPNSNSSISSHGYPAFPGAGTYWPNGQQQSPQYGPYQSGGTPQWIPPRGMFSPSLDSIVRHNGQNGEMMQQQQSYEVNQLPPFASSMSMSGSSSLQQPTLNTGMMSGASPPSTNGSHGVSPVGSQDTYSARPPPTPTYFTTQPSPNSHQLAFAPYNAPQQNNGNMMSPTNSHQHRLSVHSQGHDSMQVSGHSQSPQFQRQYGQYSLPAMNGPVMSNIQNPGGQLALVGGLNNGMMAGFNSGHAASMQHMYAGMNHSPQQQQPMNDRPFKCDQCVQSFNRNHDLKRHKRIHLAVKPYPCGHCDKSFSRKDALKRHILVKGCGKSGGSDSSGGGEKSLSISPRTTNESLVNVSPPRG